MHQVKYDTIGKNYNLTRRADAYLTSRLQYWLGQNLHHQYLDLGCGTGNYTLALSALGYSFCGVDPSQKMLDIAQQRSKTVSWFLASAEHLPFPENHFGGATGVLTVHHWSDLKQAFSEVNRILQPGSNLVLFTSNPEQMRGYWLNHYFPEMMQKSMVQMPSTQSVIQAATDAGFTHSATEIYRVHDDLQDGFLYVGKSRPELYFDVSIRNGISSFADLSHAKEVKLGLEQLRADIDSGAFLKVQKNYVHELGDYHFLCFTKS